MTGRNENRCPRIVNYLFVREPGAAALFHVPNGRFAGTDYLIADRPPIVVVEIGFDDFVVARGAANANAAS